MEEAEFYPSDYDGIHAGSPSQDSRRLMMSFCFWGDLPAQQKIRPRQFRKLLSIFSIRRCCNSAGESWRSRAGTCSIPRAVISIPRSCCAKAGKTPQPASPSRRCRRRPCSTHPWKDPANGLRLYPGFARGGEETWSLIQGALVGAFAQPLIANTVFDNPNWDWTTFNFDTDAFLVDQKLSPFINATNPDLHRLRSHGSKLLVTQGWADALNAQTLPIDHFNSVVINQQSLETTLGFYRLFMAPGISHCGGGPGPNTIGGAAPPTTIDAEHDVVAALQTWVEGGTPPDKFISTKYVNDTPAQGILRELPLCPYPGLIHYRSGRRHKG